MVYENTDKIMIREIQLTTIEHYNPEHPFILRK
ncbi:Uncharacterised protein [Alistipes sp. cv1]|nr:Uncharacterised protein [Faecalibacterium prausnitzii]